MKTAKLSLLFALEKDVQPVVDLPEPDAWMIDGMAILQSLISVTDTFADLAQVVFNTMTTLFRIGA